MSTIRGNHAKKVAAWLHTWGVPHTTSPNGLKVTVDCKYYKEFYSAMDHAVKYGLPEEVEKFQLYNSGGKP
jgi:hypothetical protein